MQCGAGLTQLVGTNIDHPTRAGSTHTDLMTTAKRKKSSSSLRIVHPYATRARIVRSHRNDNRTVSSHSVLSIASASLEAHGMLLSDRHPESDNLSSEYIADLDIQHADPAEANTRGKEKSKEHKRAKLMDEWLMYRETYLQEMLRHDGREGLQVTFCTDCDERGDFSCCDCAYSLHYCQECLVNRHRLMPLHRIKVCKVILSATVI
jgi:hypothetical protein